MPSHSRNVGVKSAFAVAARPTIIYLAISSLWIAFSDQAANILFADSVETLTNVQTLKGLFFVAATGIMIYVMVYRAVRSRQESQEDRGRIEAQLAATFEQAAVGLAHVALDGRFIRFNRRLCEIIGYDEAALSRLTYQDLTHPDDLAADSAEAKRLLRGEISECQMEKRYIRQDGSSVWIHLTASLVRSAGDPDFFVTVMEDIENRKNAELALERSQEHLQAVVENAPVILFSLGKDGTITLCEGRGLEPLGIAAGAMVGENALEEFGGVPGMSVAIERVLAGTEEHLVAFYRDHYFDVWLAPVWDEEEVTGAICVAVDQTGRIMAEQKMRELAAIVEYSDDAIVSLDMDGTVRTWNRGAEAVFGYSAAEIVGASFTRIWPPDLMDEGLKLRERIRGGEAILRFETERLRKGGERFPVALTFSPIRDSDGTVTGYAVIARDMTDHVLYERTLVEAKERAEEMSRLKTTFLANMSHEIRTPLTAIIGFSEVLIEEVEGRQHEFASMICRGGERLMETLGSVLDLAELEAGKVSLVTGRIDLVRKVSETVDLFRPRAEAAGLRLNIVAPDVPITINTDAAALNRILMNLLANAVKFTQEGEITVRIEAAMDVLSLSVEDTGIGIGKEFLPCIFDEFKQESHGISRDFEGSGLGLTITKHLVDLIGGRIEVRSERGHGTVFTVHLPKEPVRRAATN